MKIYPSILTDSLQVAQDQLRQIGQLNTDTMIAQIDIIDGIYTDNITVTPADVALMELGDTILDFHLMTDEPLDYVYECVEHQDQLPIRAIIGQVEKMSYQLDFVEDVTKHGWQVGLSLDVFTPLEAIEERIWSRLNVIQLMGIEAGEQGRVLHPSVVYKIEELQNYLDQRNLNLEILVDGGAKLENIKALLDSGADSIVVGSALWSEDDQFSLSEAMSQLSGEAA